MRHTALPGPVIDAVAGLAPDAHPMGVLLTGLCALSTCHPEANPAIAGQNIYKSREVQDKQVCVYTSMTRRSLHSHVTHACRVDVGQQHGRVTHGCVSCV